VVWLEDEYWRRLREVSCEVFYKTKPSAGERESELHYLAKAFVVRHLAERVDPNCVETEKEVGAAVFDVVVTCGGLQGLVVEAETLYGTGTVVHKLVETVQKLKDVKRAGRRKMWIVIPNPQAVIYLPLLLRTRRELGRKYDVEFYTLDVTSRGLVRLIDVAGEEMERGGRGLREVQVTRRYTSHSKRLRHPTDTQLTQTATNTYLTCRPRPLPKGIGT
jgi:hypothetical protein